MLAAPAAGRSSSTGRWIVWLALAALAALSWFGLLAIPMPMPGDSGVRALPYGALTFAMWFVMMIAMMTPSVAPTVLLFDRVARRDSGPTGLLRSAAFAAGYFSAWAGFSAVATLLQIALIELSVIDTMGATTVRWATAALLGGAALYQFMPAKQACLQQCRSPAEFIAGHFRRGLTGAWRMGAEHGLLCLGCCWALMLLLFVGGVMNLMWVAGLTIVVMLEKLAPGGEYLRLLVAAGLLCAAVATLI